MSELTEEQRAFLVGPDARMEGYYIGFDKTGNDLIDQILSAVAYAAKGAHSTDAWGYESDYDYGPLPAGKTFEWLIQEAANDAAERLTAASADEEREALAQAALDSERLRQIAEWLSMEHGHEETAKRVNIIADRHDALARRPAQTEQITFTPDTITCADCTAALIADQTN